MIALCVVSCRRVVSCLCVVSCRTNVFCVGATANVGERAMDGWMDGCVDAMRCDGDFRCGTAACLDPCFSVSRLSRVSVSWLGEGGSLEGRAKCSHTRSRDYEVFFTPSSISNSECCVAVAGGTLPFGSW